LQVFPTLTSHPPIYLGLSLVISNGVKNLAFHDQISRKSGSK
jgi:hypothetical protein